MTAIKMSGGKTFLIISLTVLSFAVFIWSAILGIVEAVPNNGIFNISILEMLEAYPSDVYYLGGWYGYSFGLFIYSVQIAWFGYAFSTMCRTNSDGPILMNPLVLPLKFHLAWIFACALGVFWLFAFLNKQFLLSAIVVAGMTLTGFVAMFINLCLTIRYQRKLASSDLTCIRVLVQNGLNLYFSWYTYVTLVNVSMAMTYDPNVSLQYSQEDAGTFCLYTYGILIIGWSILENTKLFYLVKYLYGWYFVLFYTLTGIIIRDPDVSKKNTIITITLLCLSVVCFAAKITVYALNPKKTFKKAKKYKLIDDDFN